MTETNQKGKNSVMLYFGFWWYWEEAVGK